MKWWKYIRLALKYRKVLEVVLAIGMEVRKARKSSSPGGKSLTNDELAAIGTRIIAVLEEVDGRFT